MLGLASFCIETKKVAEPPCAVRHLFLDVHEWNEGNVISSLRLLLNHASPNFPIEFAGSDENP